jgi:hypothetical protein
MTAGGHGYPSWGSAVARAQAGTHPGHTAAEAAGAPARRSWPELRRDYTRAERMQLAAKGWALPDGSYPVKDAADLADAAILAQSGHGDVSAAKALIRQRAAELGVPSPLAEDKPDGRPRLGRERVAAEDAAKAAANGR